MAKDTISQYSKTAGSNTDVQSVSIAEGMAPSDVNNAMREVMVDLASLYDGTQSLATLKTTTALSAANGTVSAPSLQATADTNTGVYFPAADTVGITAGGTEQFRFGSNPIPGGGKNLVINGAMNVSQRGTNAAILAGFDSTTTTYGPDRFLITGGGTPQNRGEVEHVSSGGPTGFPSFFRYDITTAESAVASAEFTAMQHRIEGYSLNRLSWGNAAAKDVTLSFYMRSPKTGTHCVGLGQSSNRYQVKEFTVASADTWEKHSLTFPGDTSGSMNVASTEGLRIFWPIIAGGTYNVSADTWTAGGPWLKTSNQQNLADSTSNNIDLTGVQLEVGSVATDFAHEDIGTTTEKCQRYFNRIAAGDTDIISTVHCNHSASYWYGAYHFPVEMRAIPTEATNDDTHFSILNAGASTACSAVSLSGRTSTKAISWELTTASRTVGHGGTFKTNNAASTLDLIAEL